MPQVEDAAYLAGFFDGEGHIVISKHGRGYRLNLGATQLAKHRDVLDKFATTFGGSVTRKTVTNVNARETCVWQISDASASLALKIMAPFLRVKDREAGVALNFMRLKQSGPHHSRQPLPDETVAAMEQYRQQLIALRREA